MNVGSHGRIRVVVDLREASDTEYELFSSNSSAFSTWESLPLLSVISSADAVGLSLIDVAARMA